MKNLNIIYGAILLLSCCGICGMIPTPDPNGMDLADIDRGVEVGLTLGPTRTQIIDALQDQINAWQQAFQNNTIHIVDNAIQGLNSIIDQLRQIHNNAIDSVSTQQRCNRLIIKTENFLRDIIWN